MPVKQFCRLSIEVQLFLIHKGRKGQRVKYKVNWLRARGVRNASYQNLNLDTVEKIQKTKETAVVSAFEFSVVLVGSLI